MNKLLPALGLLLVMPQAWAATFNVDSTADTVDASPGDGTCATAGAVCTLRAAIQEANAWAGADTVAIPAGTYTLTLIGAGEDGALTGDLDVTDDVTLAGASPTATVIDGNRTDRVLDVIGATVQISDLTIEKGDSLGDDGGGIQLDDGSSVTIVDTTIRDNDGVFGGGVFADGILVVSQSSVYGNRADRGGGIYSSGASPNVNLTNLTVSGNTAAVRGGGIELDWATLTNVTITGNGSPDGGGVYRRGSQPFTVGNSIVADNPTGGDCSATFTSLGYNLDSDGTCALGAVGDISSGTANLGPLANNGGPTLTHALLIGSNAIDAVLAGCPPPATDQRGAGRPFGAACDIGAYEGLFQPMKIVKRAFQSDGTPIPSAGSLPPGVPLKFMLYINNPNPIVQDVSMQDILDPVFLYLAGSIKYDNSVATCALTDCTVAEEAAIFAATDSGTVGTDALDGDAVNFAGVTLDVGNENVANAQLDIAGSKVWAVIFSFRIQ